MTTPTLESYSSIQEAYDYFNRILFSGALPTCLITYQRQKRTMGYVSFRRWVNQHKHYVDELAINPEYFANYPTIEICQTLCHEMVHIWQAHHGSPGRRGYHNKEWAGKMQSIGLMPSSTDKPGGDTTGEKMGDYILANGDFIKACELLIAGGFHLRWVDRYPVHRGTAPVVVYENDGNAIESELCCNETRSVASVTPLKLTGAAGNSKTLDREDYDALLTVGYQEDFTVAKPMNRSNRHKYQCCQCRMQLWGKPGLNVVCGDCAVALVEILGA